MEATKINKTITVSYEGEGRRSVFSRRIATLISAFPAKPNDICVTEEALVEFNGSLREAYRYINQPQWFLSSEGPFFHTSPIHPYAKYLEGSEWYLKPIFDECYKCYFFEPRKHSWDLGSHTPASVF